MPGHVFLCHAGVETDLARELKQVLEQVGLKVWLDVDEPKTEQRGWGEAIEQAVGESVAFLVLIDQVPLRRWVTEEVRLALRPDLDLSPAAVKKNRDPKQVGPANHPLLGSALIPALGSAAPVDDLAPAFLWANPQTGGFMPHSVPLLEIDLLAEIGTGSVIAFEIKATAAPKPEDAEHMAWLRDQLGPRFLSGALLHTGPHSFPLGDRLQAAPICTLWAQGALPWQITKNSRVPSAAPTIGAERLVPHTSGATEGRLVPHTGRLNGSRW